MAAASLSEFKDSIKSSIILVREAIRKKSKFVQDSKLSEDLVIQVASLRKAFLKLSRDYPIERYPRIAFQLSSIDPLVSKFISSYPQAPKEMLILLNEISFKVHSDISAEIDLEDRATPISTAVSYLPDDLVEDRHFAHKKTLWEINRTYEIACYNSCAAMIRRLTESLIIEAYEQHSIRNIILDSSGDYLGFKDLIGKACAQIELKLTRETKRVLPDLKFYGDIAVHNRSVIVRKADLDRLHNATRLAIEELYRAATSI